MEDIFPNFITMDICRDDAIDKLQIINNLRKYLALAACCGSTKDCAYVRKLAIQNGIDVCTLDIPRALYDANTHNHIDTVKFLTGWIEDLEK